MCSESATLKCDINDATVQSTLFEDSDSTNILCAFNSTQLFLNFLKKLLLTRYRAQTKMLAIILLRNGYM